MGLNVAWLMDETSYQASVNIGDISGVNWRIVAPK
jgi:hypothetical protein